MIKTVADIIKENPRDMHTLSPEDSVYKAIQILADHNQGALMVVEHGRLLGILSERDYTRKVVLENKTEKNTQVKEIMSTRLVYVSPEETAESCLQIMKNMNVRHLPVIYSDGSIMGFISVLDVANTLLAERIEVTDQYEKYASETWPF